jgi:hypothetical protein
MSGKKKSRASPDVTQLYLDFSDTSNTIIETPKVVIPVETTFDVSQGIREAKMFAKDNNYNPISVEFNAHHLELAEKYISSKNYEPTEQYITGEGGLINTAVFINILRCQETLLKWSKSHQAITGQPTIKNILFEEPQKDTVVGKLWRNLGCFPYGNNENVSTFQSRYITPIYWVDQQSKDEVFQKLTRWTENIAYRIGQQLKTDLNMLFKEIITTLSRHGLAHGYLCISVWRTGQIEVIWSSTIKSDQASEHQSFDLIQELKQIQVNEGISYIYENLMQMYNGLLVTDYQGAVHSLNSTGLYRIHSQSSRQRTDFYPNSALFTLHLFCPQARET